MFAIQKVLNFECAKILSKIIYKETLVIHYEKEEEFMTNQLSKKMNYLKNEKVELEVCSPFIG